MPRPIVDENRLSGALALYLPLAAALCFWRLGVTGFVQMEGMVADGGRHMLQSGDWAVPRVFGEIYTYKPALAYWLAALAHALADPPSTWLLRLPFAASVFVMGLVVLLLIARITNPRFALFCSLASLSGGLFIQKLRIAEFDAILAAGVGLATAAACCNLAAKRAGAGVWLVGYLGLTFGFLAKGLPALMVYGPGLLAAALVTRRFRRLFDWRHLVAALLFVLLAGGYLFSAYRSVGRVAFDQPLAESKLRGFGWDVRQENKVLAAREGADVSTPAGRAVLGTLVKPLYVFVAFFPVSLLLPFAFAPPGGRRREAGWSSLERGARAFLVTGVVVFMLVPTHEMRYYLPLSVPVGILCGAVLAGDRAQRPGRRRGILVASVVSAGLVATAMTLFGWFSQTPPVPYANRVVLVAGGALLLGWALLSLRRTGSASAAVLMLFAVAGTLAVESLGSQLRRASKRDLRLQALELARRVPAGEPVWVLGPSDLAGKSSSLFYSLGRPIRTFRPGVGYPPPGSYCILSSDRMDELEGATAFVFEEITRVRDPWRSYLLGMCSGPAAVGSSSPR